MRVLVCAVLLAAMVAATPVDQKCGDSSCPTPNPGGSIVRCPECVSAQCTPQMCNLAQHLPYPGDCAKFCQCEVGGAIEMPCAPGTVFDPDLQVCVWPYQSTCSNDDPYPGCEADPTEPTSTEAPTTKAPTTEAPTTEAPTTKAPTTEAPTTEAPTTPACTTIPPAPVQECPACVTDKCTPQFCDLAYHLPYPGDCNRFCVCTHSGAVAMDCPDGLVFDVDLQVCVWSDGSSCTEPTC